MCIPVGLVCNDCNSMLDLFVDRNNFEYAFVEEEDDEILEWFEKASAEFVALSIDFGNCIGRVPSQEAKQHLHDESVTIVSIARQWLFSMLRKSTRTSKSKFILIREDKSSMWTIRMRKHFMYIKSGSASS